MVHVRGVYNPNEVTEIVIIMTVLSLAIIPSAFFMGQGGPSGVLLLLGIIIGIIAFLLSWVNISISRTNKQRIARLFLTFIVSLPVVASFSILSSTFSRPTEIFAHSEKSVKSAPTASPELKQNQVEQDPKLLSALQSIGAKGNYSNLALSYHQGDMAAMCGSKNSLACYKSDGQNNQSLIISQQSSSYHLKTTLAHEYLHYAWHKYDLENDKVLVSHLIDFYAKNPDLQQLIPDHYLNSGGLHAGEIFSFACTELTANRLDGYISSKCSAFIDLSKLPITRVTTT